MLKAIKRDTVGTRGAKKLRAQGRIPASIQGGGEPNLDVSIDAREFMALRRAHEHVFDISVDGGAESTALVKELQWDTIAERILHVEFRRVKRGQKTEVEVEIEFEGNPKGGVTNHLVTHVTILAQPQDIPDFLAVSMDGREPGHVVHARDLVLPPGVELAVSPDLAIASVAVPRGVEEEPKEGETPAPLGQPTPPPAE